MFTTIEAAALLTERGHGGYRGKPLTADAVKHMCARGIFPNAQKRRGPGRGYWLIPQADLDAFVLAREPARIVATDLRTC